MHTTYRKQLLTTVAITTLLTTTTVHAVDGTWMGPGPTAEFTTDANWSSGTVPGTGNTAIFTNNSAATSVTVSGILTVGTMQFDTGTPAYSFSIPTGGNRLTLDGAGIVNHSANAPYFNISAGGGLLFHNASSAGNASIYNVGLLNFNNTSTADNAVITNVGDMAFNDSGTASSATITNHWNLAFNGASSAGTANITTNWAVRFYDTSTASNATITNNPFGITYFYNTSSAASATITTIGSGETRFYDTSSAGSATINNGGTIAFYNTSTADTATINNNGTTYFRNASSAGNATVINDSGGITQFLNTSSAGGATIITNDGGSTYFAASASGGTARFITDAGGRVDLSNLTTSGTTAGSIEGGGAYYLGSKAFTVGSNNLSTAVSGIISDGGGAGGAGGSLVKVGTGTLTLTGANTYTGGTMVSAGTLRAGAAGAFSPSSAVTVATGATLDLDGLNQTVAGLSNAGLVNMGTGTAPGTVLTVTGAYVGNGGTVAMNAVLNEGGANSRSDLLVADSTQLGSAPTRIVVNNAGGLGAQTVGNGIELVEVLDKNASAADVFALGNHVAAGAYDYQLFHNGVGADSADGNWYLRSGLRPEVVVDAAIPALASRLGLAMLGTYFHRSGDTAISRCAGDTNSPNEPCPPLRWGRVFGETGTAGRRTSHGSLGSGGPVYRFGFGGFQVGADLHRTTHDSAGLYAGAGWLDATVRGLAGGNAGKVSADHYAIGGYWTHHGPGGWYTDLVPQLNRYQNIHATAFGGQGISTRGSSLAVSGEVGYRLALGSGYAVVPQAQLIYQRSRIKGVSDAYSRIDFGATDEVYGRLGGRLAKDWMTGAGGAVTAWADVNLWHQFGGDAKTTFFTLQNTNPTPIAANLGGSWAQIGLGLSSRLSGNASVFGGVDYNTALDQAGHSVSGRAGLKIHW